MANSSRNGTAYVSTDDYVSRAYAGVLGKLIGVYLGRPIENIAYRDAVRRFGQVDRYLNDRLKQPLIVTDDDITGTFTFVRTLEDRQSMQPLTAFEVGQTWLNYVIENRTIFWWGGMGMSTEHTAFLRLKCGIPAPRSGSAELNSTVVAEQIGSQIFIDAWAILSPGDPQRAADWADAAARVSHDGEAVHAAKLIAAMEAQAFVESDLNRLFDVGLQFIPRGCVIARMIDRLREYRAKHDDWRDAMEGVLEAEYGYDKFGGNCHVVPNHGVIALALLWGNDDFTRSLMIANTCGWDTDCNSGNVGCLMGIKNGLIGMSVDGAGQSWRTPIADRMFLPTAEGSRSVTDALSETYRLVNTARRLAVLPPLAPKDGARYHFSQPGSVQGFVIDTADNSSAATLSNDDGRLAITLPRLPAGGRVRTVVATFIAPEARQMPGYGLLATPALSPGQTVTATLQAGSANPSPIVARLVVGYYGPGDTSCFQRAAPHSFAPGASASVDWVIPDLGGRPTWCVGLEIEGPFPGGRLFLDRLHFTGTPTVTLRKFDGEDMWRRAWIDAADTTNLKAPGDFTVIQNAGRGMLIHGTADWTDYTVRADVLPHLAEAAGIAARVNGLERYYALLLTRPDRVRLVRRLDGETVLDEAAFPWLQNDQKHAMALTVHQDRIQAFVDGRLLFDRRDPAAGGPLARGGIGLVVDEGRVHVGPVSVSPVR